MATQQAARNLIEYIEAMIAGGRFAPGDRLPTLRELAASFKITPSTARRALKELCEKGLLEFRHGAGTFVRSALPPHPGGRCLSVLGFKDALRESYCAYAMQGLQTAAAGSDWQLRIFFLPYLCDRFVVPPEVWLSDAVAFFGCYDCSDLSEFRRRQPCVGLEMHESMDGIFSTVTLDPFNAAETAAGHFRRLGIRHVRIIDIDMPVHKIRTMIFADYWKRFGTSEFIAENDPLLDRADRLPADTGLYCVSGSIYNRMAVACRQAGGRRLAACANILSVDGKSLINPGYEPANTISIDWGKAGEAVFEECARRVETPGSAARRIYLNGTLHLYDGNDDRAG